MTSIKYFFGGQNLRLLLFGGKGGVGKTSCATAASLYLARSNPQSSFLLVSTDPAHSLSDSLAGLSPPANLEVLDFDAKACLANFKESHKDILKKIASRGTFLDDEDISNFFNLSLPGLDELMAFLEIAEWVEDNKYDLIVVDTAPTGHTLRLLAMPKLTLKWLDVLDVLLAKHRYMKRLFSRSYQGDKLDQFLFDLSGSVKKMETLLQNPVHCCFVPVMLAEELSILETVGLLDELKRLNVHVADIVVNRVYPKSDCALCSDRHEWQMTELQQASHRLSGYRLWKLPMYAEEVRGEGPLKTFWENVSLLDSLKNVNRNKESSPRKSSFFYGPMVELPADLPPHETKLLLFAGKGGVGKTTLACATAIRLAREQPDKEIFLFSTDPAHSLSACLDIQIGPKPTRLIRGLTAMEIDADTEFEALKSQYKEDIEELLDTVSSHLDFAFDREVMERLMDLSPTGIDEVMALTMSMDFLTSNKYQIFVFDTAPTGHLIRLLETPELIEQWLKVFFNLFLKYKTVFSLPRISKRMVKLSKDLKYLRKLLRDPGSSALYAVSILTRMSFEETKDLVETCERMGVCVPRLFFNLVTPFINCPLCLDVFRRESKVREKFEQDFSEKYQTLVYLQEAPRGIERLGELGEVLYGAKGKEFFVM